MSGATTSTTWSRNTPAEPGETAALRRPSRLLQFSAEAAARRSARARPPPIAPSRRRAPRPCILPRRSSPCRSRMLGRGADPLDRRLDPPARASATPAGAATSRSAKGTVTVTVVGGGGRSGDADSGQGGENGDDRLAHGYVPSSRCFGRLSRVIRPGYAFDPSVQCTIALCKCEEGNACCDDCNWPLPYTA